MKSYKFGNADLDQLISHSLATSKEHKVPEKMVDLTIRKIQKRILLKELILELAVKAGVVAGSLGLLTISLIVTGSTGILKMVYDFAIINKPVIILLLTTSIAIIIIDQVVLRFYSTREESPYLQ